MITPEASMSTLTRTALCLLLAIPLCAFTAGSCEGGGAGKATSSPTQSFGAGGAGGGGAGSSGGMGGAGASGGGGGVAVAVTECANQVYACGNGLDDDGDGLVDAQDAQCLGACDNTEDSFHHGIPGSKCVGCYTDCYFDADSGSGNDQCYWSHQCDPLEVAPDYYPEWSNGSKCAHDEDANIPGTDQSCEVLRNDQSPTCLGICPPLTPNGCDCFGCCELPAGSGKFVWLETEDGLGDGSCSLEDFADPKKCAPCTPVKGACYNACDTCELCIGKTALPPECTTDAGNLTQCAPGLQPCGLSGQDACPAGTYCITGCCQPTLQ